MNEEEDSSDFEEETMWSLGNRIMSDAGWWDLVDNFACLPILE